MYLQLYIIYQKRVEIDSSVDRSVNNLVHDLHHSVEGSYDFKTNLPKNTNWKLILIITLITIVALMVLVVFVCVRFKLYKGCIGRIPCFTSSTLASTLNAEFTEAQEPLQRVQSPLSHIL